MAKFSQIFYSSGIEFLTAISTNLFRLKTRVSRFQREENIIQPFFPRSVDRYIESIKFVFPIAIVNKVIYEFFFSFFLSFFLSFFPFESASKL